MLLVDVYPGLMDSSRRGGLTTSAPGDDFPPRRAFIGLKSGSRGLLKNVCITDHMPL